MRSRQQFLFPKLISLVLLWVQHLVLSKHRLILQLVNRPCRGRKPWVSSNRQLGSFHWSQEMVGRLISTSPCQMDSVELKRTEWLVSCCFRLGPIQHPHNFLVFPFLKGNGFVAVPSTSEHTWSSCWSGWLLEISQAFTDPTVPTAGIIAQLMERCLKALLWDKRGRGNF